MGKLELALADHNRAVDLAPQDSTLYSNRSSVYIDMDELTLASRDCEKSLELNLEDVGASYNYACIFSLLDNVGEALEHLTMAVKLDPLEAQQAQNDPHLQRLLEDPRVEEILGE